MREGSTFGRMRGDNRADCLGSGRAIPVVDFCVRPRLHGLGCVWLACRHLAIRGSRMNNAMPGDWHPLRNPARGVKFLVFAVIIGVIALLRAAATGIPSRPSASLCLRWHSQR